MQPGFFTGLGSIGTIITNGLLYNSGSSCIISADLIGLDGAPIPGVKLLVWARVPVAKGGKIINSATATDTTDENGHAQVSVPQGVVVNIDFPPLTMRLTADTTGKPAINVADLIV